jgi:hypothetical protein
MSSLGVVACLDEMWLRKRRAGGLRVVTPSGKSPSHVIVQAAVPLPRSRMRTEEMPQETVLISNGHQCRRKIIEDDEVESKGYGVVLEAVTREAERR